MNMTMLEKLTARQRILSWRALCSGIMGCDQGLLVDVSAQRTNRAKAPPPAMANIDPAGATNFN
jgi:hypothetical protein